MEEGDTLCLPVIPHSFWNIYLEHSVIHPPISNGFEHWYNPIAERDSFFCVKIDSVRIIPYDGNYLETVFTSAIVDIVDHGGGDINILYPAYNYSTGLFDEIYLASEFFNNRNGYARTIGSLSTFFLPTPMYKGDIWIGGSTDTSSLGDIFYTGFRCYQDDNININLYPDKGDCDHIFTVNIEEEQNNRLSLNIYPNPANEKVHIKTGDFSREGNIKIYDNLGRLRLENRFLNKENTLDISKLNSGVYYLKITIDEQEYTEKLILEKR